MVFHCLEIELNYRLLYVNMAYSECKVCSKYYLGIIYYSGLDIGIDYYFKYSCSLSLYVQFAPCVYSLWVCIVTYTSYMASIFLQFVVGMIKLI